MTEIQNISTQQRLNLNDSVVKKNGILVGYLING